MSDNEAPKVRTTAARLAVAGSSYSSAEGYSPRPAVTQLVVLGPPGIRAVEQDITGAARSR
jgi:hypothetical protein